MKIDLNSIDKELFDVSRRAIEGLGEFYLIQPNDLSVKWNNNNLHLRSVMCNLDGEIVSSGFPKFFNHGENVDSDRILLNALRSGQVPTLSMKEDGSLIIRDVINGVVHFRTRGNHDLGDFHKDVMTIIRKQYRLLLDPEIGVHQSILFEYTSESNRIIVAYNTPKLTYLATMHRGIGKIPEIVFNNPFSSVEEAEQFNFEYSSIDELISSIRNKKGVEGIIIRVVNPDTGMFHLIKLKSLWYLYLHSMKFSLGRNRILELCVKLDLEHDADEKLSAFGLDFEAIDVIRPYIDEYKMQHLLISAKLNSLIRELHDAGICNLQSRKEKAALINSFRSKHKEYIPYAFSWLDNHSENMNYFVDCKILQCSMQRINQIINQDFTYNMAGDEYVKD